MRVTRSPGRLLESLEAHARRDGAQALRFLHRDGIDEYSYADLWQVSGHKAATLAGRGVGPGTRVALPMATRWETMVSIIALFRLGATLVPLVHQPRLRPGKPQTRSALTALRIGRASHLLATVAELEAWATLLEADGRDTQRIAIDADSPSAVSRLSLPYRDADPAPSILQFSSGSTADPKGIFLEEQNVLACVDGIIERFGVCSDDRFFSWLPLFHDMGLLGFLFTPLRAGADLTLWPSQQFVRQPLGWVEGLSNHRATITCGPQFSYNLCLEKSRLAGGPAKQLDLSSLRLALNGSEPVHYESCRQFQQHFASVGLRPNIISACYGLAENGLAVTLRRSETPMVHRHFERQALFDGEARLSPEPSDSTLTLTANGFPITGTEVRCCDGKGNPVELPRIGEIQFRGTAAARAFASGDGKLRPSAVRGWVQSGDLGVEIDGELYIVGRVKELFKRGGQTFVPNDIEISLLAQPEVEAGGIAAVGVPDPQTSLDELVLFVELSPRQSLGDLPDRLRLQVLREYHLPVRAVIPVLRHGLPKTTSGKIRRLALRHAHASGRLEDLVRLHPAAAELGNTP